MKAIFITITFLYILACSNSELSDKIYKSQIKYYKSQKIDMKEMYHLRSMNDARKDVFKELEKNDLGIFNITKLYLIEGYDFSCGEISGAIIINDKIFYYEGLSKSNSYSISDKPTIDNSYIHYYLENYFSKLRDPLVNKSTSYIGSTIILEKRIELSHFSW